MLFLSDVRLSDVSFSFWLTPVGVDALFIVSHTLELNIRRLRRGKKRRFFNSKKILYFPKKREIFFI